MKASISPNNPNYCIKEDLDDSSTVWEFRYDIPLNTPERLLYRKLGLESWDQFPSFIEPPDDVMEFFHGPKSNAEFNCLPWQGYPSANQIGFNLCDALKDLLILKGEITQDEDGNLHEAPEETSTPRTMGSVAEALCTLAETFNF
jgi:hypothetical protein